MKNKKMALIFNALLVISEVVGLIWTSILSKVDLIYYTNLSNIFALIVGVLFIIFYNKKNDFIKDLRFMSTSCLTVTFLVVIFILCPMYHFNYKLLMFTNVFFIFHTLCPLLSIISYILFEERSNKVYLGFLFTLVYGIILLVLNYFNIVSGPYPFLKVHNQSIIMTIIWSISIIGSSYLISILLNTLNKKLKRS